MTWIVFGQWDQVILTAMAFTTCSSTATNGNYVLRNDGQGQFESPALVAPADDLARWVSDGVDLDGDNDIDAIISTRGNAQWLNNLGNGQFELLSVSPEAAEFDEAVVNGLLDLDDDGDIDLYGRTNIDDEAVLFVNQEGAFSKVLLDPYYRDIVAAIDIDSDGDLDLIARTSEGFAWIANDGQGTFSDGGLMTIQDTASRTPRFEVGDIDGDGVSDLVSC